MATKAAELVSAYGDISNAPGRRCKIQGVETVATETNAALVAATNVGEAFTAIADITIADRAVTGTSIGRATSVEAS